jgi:peptidoglycan hydrolase CwlO-like protein
MPGSNIKKIVVALMVILLASPVYASRINELRSQIGERSDAIEELEREIREYQGELMNIGREATTLENSIARYNYSIRKLNADVRLTESKIETASLRIEELGLEILNKEQSIKRSTLALGESLKRMREAEERSIVEAVLTARSLSSFWDEMESIQKFQQSVQTNLKNLRELKGALGDDKTEIEDERDSFLSLQKELDVKKQVEESEKNAKAGLLRETKNKEASFKELLEEKLARKEAFESWSLNLSSL